jgi:hypothetical protein
MKKLLLAIAILSSVTARSQNTINYSFCFNPVQPTNIDSIQLTATLLASSGYGGIKFAYVSGPNTPIFGNPTNIFQNTMFEQSTVTVRGLAPGVYVFSATGTSAPTTASPAQSTTLNITVTILPAPTPPAPPTFSGVTVTQTFFGQKLTFTIPPGYGTTITFTYNGVTQTVTF